MKKLIVGNFKSNKTEREALQWILEFSKNYKEDPQKEVIICPSFTALSAVRKFIDNNNLNVSLGAQNVSSFDKGPFTGEINAQQLYEFCSYCIVGHSERREKFSEDLSLINDKIARLIEYKITPITCISQIEQLGGIQNLDKCVIAYEPLFAVGSDHPQDPGEALKFGKSIKDKVSGPILYGGSVSPQNVASYTDFFDGVLVGEDSLDPSLFSQIVKNA